MRSLFTTLGLLASVTIVIVASRHARRRSARTGRKERSMRLEMCYPMR